MEEDKKALEFEESLQHGWADSETFKLKDTDHIYSARTDSFDWNQGYDVEVELKNKLHNGSFRLTPNNQLQTLSCGAQAISKLGATQNVLLDNEAPRYIDFSARDAYSHNFLSDGGVYAWDIALWAKNNGILPEEDLPSEPMREDVMRNKGLEEDGFSESYKVKRQMIKGGDIQIVANNIDAAARAIRDNGGILVGVRGKNNGTWSSVRPVPPESIQDSVWGHLMYAGKARINNGRKEIGILNSWGNIGDNGWQWFGENWFGTPFVRALIAWVPFVQNIENFAKYMQIKDYIQANPDKNFMTTGNWAEIKSMFNTDISRGNFYDVMQMIKNL
jgi:hypothetical protein